MAELRIGISGWTYASWRGTFYPKGWPRNRELEFASRQVNSIEINGSFYSLQQPTSYRKWYEQTPKDFSFAVKGGRTITHFRKLIDPVVPLANFFSSGLLALEEKLGPILWQLPPVLKFNRARLESFFRLLPKTTGEAVRLCRKQSKYMEGRSFTEVKVNRPIRHALEIRHPSFACPEFIELMRHHGMGLVLADTAGKWPYFEDITADFVYIRLHGPEDLYVSGYDDASLDHWARRIEYWKSGRQPPDASCVSPVKPTRHTRDIYVYLDNDVKAHAPFDAMKLMSRWK